MFICFPDLWSSVEHRFVLKTMTSDRILAVVHRSIVFFLCISGNHEHTDLQSFVHSTVLPGSFRRRCVLDSADECSPAVSLDHCSLCSSKCAVRLSKNFRPACWTRHAFDESWPSVCVQLMVTWFVIVSTWNFSRNLCSAGTSARGNHVFCDPS